MDAVIYPINTSQKYLQKNNLRQSGAEYSCCFNSEKKQKNFNTASAVTMLAVSSVVMLLMFSKGVQKSTGSILYRFRKSIESKKEDFLLKGADKKAKFCDTLIKSADLFMKRADSINNITSLKDILFKKIMYETRPTKKLHIAITKYFESLSKKTIKDSYINTGKQFEKMYKIFDSLDESILKDSSEELIEHGGEKYTKKQLVEKARESRDFMKQVVDAFISESAQQMRYRNIKKATSTLYSRFWDVSFKDFWTKDNRFQRKEMWQTFIAAEQVKYDKADITGSVGSAQKVISYLPEDRKNTILDCIDNIEKIISPNDAEAVKTIQMLKKWFFINPENIYSNKETFLKELDKLEKSSADIDKEIAAIQQKNKLAYIEIIRYSLADSKSLMAEMMDIYYKIAPDEFLNSGANLAIKKAVNSFNESVYLETGEFFDKERDLVLGSAPTDVLTILLSFIMISLGLGYAKDKNERISVVVKSGIPVVGAIATSVISATKLVSGGKSLALGALSGIALNQLGNIVDAYRKKNQTENQKHA